MIRMNKATRRLLRENYDDACNAYADAFCEKHGWYKPGESATTFWVADEPGGILNIGDTAFSMQTILTDIDEDAPENEVLNWDDYCSEVWDVMGHGHEVPNFHSWLHGCPRISEDVLQHIREQKKRLKKAIEEAEDY